MQVSRNDKDGVAVLTLSGEFDSFETDLVKTGFEACLAEGHKSVVFDIGPMTFANSTTIAYFITAQRTARAAAGEVMLACPQDMIRKALMTLGLVQVFPISDDLDEAIEKVKAKR